MFKNDLHCKRLVILRLQDNSLIGRINALKNLFDNYFTLISQDNFIVASNENVLVKKFQIPTPHSSKSRKPASEYHLSDPNQVL